MELVMHETDPKKPNLALVRSIQLHMEFGVLMTVAFLVATFARW
jgi:hypothetical protein